MRTLTKRLLTTFIGIPLLACIIYFLPHQNYLAFCILVFVFAILGSKEMKYLLEKNSDVKISFPFYIPSILIIISYIESRLSLGYNLTIFTFTTLSILIFVIETFIGPKDNFKSSKERISSSLFLIIYPNLFATFFINFAFLDNAMLWLASFFVVVFASDISAWLFGMLFGKSTRDYVKVSPNKSLVGFIAGAIVPAILMCIASCFNYFGLTVFEGLILGFLTAIAAIFGDLAESTFKRFANMKDSGSIIPGRGGILDSIDSLLIALPLFILLLKIFLNN